jgi:hypothetical protein
VTRAWLMTIHVRFLWRISESALSGKRAGSIEKGVMKN